MKSNFVLDSLSIFADGILRGIAFGIWDSGKKPLLKATKRMIRLFRLSVRIEEIEKNKNQKTGAV